MLEFELNEPPAWELAAPSEEMLRDEANEFLAAFAAAKGG